MKHFSILVVSAVICVLLSTGVSAGMLSAASYKAALDELVATHKVGIAVCVSLTGNAEDVCEEKSDGKFEIDKAELEAANWPSLDNNHELRAVKAKVAYSIAKEKCDDFDGDSHDICRKNAKEAYFSERADAKVMDKITSLENKAGEETTAANADTLKTMNEALMDTTDDEFDAGVPAAMERCHLLAGDAIENCLDEGEVHYD